jgi:hypothetical protein
MKNDKEIESNFHTMNCNELGDELRDFAGLNHSNKKIARMSFGSIAYTSIFQPGGAEFNRKLREQAKEIYDIFQAKRCGR